MKDLIHLLKSRNVFERFWFWAIFRAVRKLDDNTLRGELEHFIYAHTIG